MEDVIGTGEWEEFGWDDVKNVEFPAKLVRSGRLEEVAFMENRTIWDVRDVQE